MNVVKPWVFASMSACSGAMGVPLEVLKDAKDKGCPAFQGGGRVDYQSFSVWFFNGGDEEVSKPDDGTSSWKESLDKQRALKEKLIVEQRSGKLMDIAEGKRQAGEACGFLFGELDRVTRELPPMLKGRDETAVHAELVKSHAVIKKNAKVKFDLVGEQTDEKE